MGLEDGRLDLSIARRQIMGRVSAPLQPFTTDDFREGRHSFRPRLQRRQTRTGIVQSMVLQPTDLNATARKAVLKLAATSVAPIDTAATAPDGFSLGSARNPTADSRWNGLPRFSWGILASLSGKPENPVLHSGLCCQQRSAVTWRQMASQRSTGRESPFEAVLRYTSL
jgi:hypothetical protein